MHDQVQAERAVEFMNRRHEPVFVPVAQREIAALLLEIAFLSRAATGEPGARRATPR
jgi:hypothetical protein